VYLELEYWVERLIQLCKSKVRYRTHEYPEKVLANFLLEGTAIEHFKAEVPRVQELVDRMSGASSRARVSNLDASDDGTHMLGTGRVATASEWETMIKPAVCDFCDRESDHDTGSYWAGVDASTFHIGDVDGSSDSIVTVLVYTSANLRGEEIVTSKEHMRSRTRESCYVATTYEINGENVDYVAIISKLVKLEHASSGGVKCLRFALCDFFRRAAPGNRVQYLVDVKDPDLGDMWKVMNTGDDMCMNERNYLVEMSTIDTKVVKCKSGDGDTLHFLSYSFSSGIM
jgi:hypothetical protein